MMAYRVLFSSLRAIPLVTVLAVLPLLLGSPGTSRGQSDPVVVAIVFDGPWEQNDEMRELFQGEILALTEGEFDVEFPADKMIEADWTVTRVRDGLDQLLNDGEVDLVIAVGLVASQQLALWGPLPKPAIAPFAVHDELLGLPRDGNSSGVTNLNYLTHPAQYRRDLEVFQRVVPFDHLVVLYFPRLLDASPVRRREMEREALQMGITVSFLPVEAPVEVALDALPPDTDAVYLPPLLHLTPAETDRLYQGLIERRLPSLAMMGRREVERGAMVTLTPDNVFARLARRTALNVQRILLGEPPGEIPVDFRIEERLLINLDTARAIARFPPFQVLIEAELLGEEEPIDRELTLTRAIDEAVTANLDLAASERGVLAGYQETGRARSTLFPQLEATSLSTWIDEDRAAASFGLQAQRTSTGTLRLSQLLYSEPAWANLDVQRHLQRAREFDGDALRLDVVQATATAYLNVLQAKTAERIERDNLALTRANLEMARSRREIGIANPAEVFRWESEVSLSHRRVVDARALTRKAEIELNRLLHRPLDERLATVDVSLEDPLLTPGDSRFFRYIRDPLTFEVFADLMVSDGLAEAPELRRLEAAIAANERLLRSATRAFYTPVLALQGQLDRQLEESGAGIGQSLALGTRLDLPTADDTDWSLGLSLSIPVWTSGARSADRNQAREELAQLRYQRAAVAERVEQRIRNALEAVQASYSGIQLARAGATAANRSLDLVSDGYARGVVSILDLLDAQNAALTADLAQAASKYQFLIDVMELERAANQIDFFQTPADREAWFQRLEQHLIDAGHGGS